MASIKTCVDCFKVFDSRERQPGGPARQAQVVKAPASILAFGPCDIIRRKEDGEYDRCNRCGTSRNAGKLIGPPDDLHYLLSGNGETGPRKVLGFAGDRCYVSVRGENGNFVPDVAAARAYLSARGFDEQLLPLPLLPECSLWCGWNSNKLKEAPAGKKKGYKKPKKPKAFEEDEEEDFENLNLFTDGEEYGVKPLPPPQPPRGGMKRNADALFSIDAERRMNILYLPC